MKKLIVSFMNTGFLFLAAVSISLASPVAFQAPITIDTNVSPRGIAVGNLYGNGKQSLIVAGFGISTFIGQSTPQSLISAQTYSLQILILRPPV